MIASGEKTEEYREIKSYWFERLVFQYKKAFKYCTGYDYSEGLYRLEGMHYTLQKNMNGFAPYDLVTFRNGYSKDAPVITVECKGIEVREGNLEWGAEAGVKYFVIKLGNIISKH